MIQGRMSRRYCLVLQMDLVARSKTRQKVWGRVINDWMWASFQELLGISCVVNCWLYLSTCRQRVETGPPFKVPAELLLL